MKSGISMRYIFVLLAIVVLGSVNMSAQTTWYTLASGDWNESTIWTLDPAGAVPVGSVGSDGPTGTDNVVILSGKTVTVPDGVSPYDPADNLDLTAGTVTIYGQLDLRTSTPHSFAALNGTGRLLMAGDNYPTITDDSDFITLDEGAGTVVYYGSSYSVAGSHTFCHVEVDMTPGQTVSFANDLTLNGTLTVKTGTFQINNGGTTALTVTINGDINVEANGLMSVGSGNAFHWLEVYGNFTNAGSVDFTNSAQYADATNGAVKVKFKGSTDNDFQCNNTTQLYRLFVDKGVDKTFKINVTGSNSSNFSLYGPVSGATTDASDGTDGWQRLPVVIENGTLELGSNIVVDRLGENIDGNNIKEFSIPSTGQLWVNGATVTTSASTGSWNGITIYGNLKVSAGSLTAPASTDGIYYASTGDVPQLEISGGTVTVPQLRPYSNADKFVFTQSGGVLHFSGTPNDDNSSAVLHIGNNTAVQPGNVDTDYVFNMSGGTMRFSNANAANGWVSGIRLELVEGNYSVTGGTVDISGLTGSNPFDIYSTIPLYNLTITSSSPDVQVTGWYGGSYNATWSTDFNLLGDLSIASGTTFNDQGHSISIGADLSIAGTYTQSGNLVFVGAQDGEIINNTAGTLTLPGLHINKDRHGAPGTYYSMSLTGSNNIIIDGTLKLTRGAFDAINFNAQVKDSIVIVDGSLLSSGTGGLELTGTSRQYIKGALGKEQEFGRLILNNTSSTPQVQLVSDINATSVSFSRNQVMNLDIYNLDLAEADYYSWGWSTSSNYSFRTAGNSADGGLTIPVSLTANYASETLVQLVPIETTTGYSPVGIYATGDFSSVNDNGKVTIKPVNSYHPTVKTPGDVVQYYWRASYSEFSAADENNLRYRMYSPAAIAGNMNASMVFANNTWNNSGGSETNETIDYPISTFISGDFTQGKTSAFNAPRILYSRGSGVFDDKSTWSESSHSGSQTNAAPDAYDICIVGGTSGTNHTVTIDANSAVASQIEILGNSDLGNSGTPPTLYVQSGTTGHSVDLIKGNGRLLYENNYNYYSNYAHIVGDHSELCNSAEAIIEYTSSGSGPHIIPLDSNLPYYPNLTISETSGETRTTNSMDVIVNGDLTVTSGTFFLDGNYSEYISVGGDVVINTGTLTYESTGIRYMEIDGSISFTGAGAFNASGGTENFLYLEGDISVGSGTLDFASGNLSIYFQGDANSIYSTGGNVADFYRLVVAKSTGIKTDFISDFNLLGLTNTASKALELVSGECHLNNSNIKIDLTTGSNDFNIPSSSSLYVTSGDIYASNNSGVKLDGSLIINGGSAYLNGSESGGGSSNSSYIEFTSSGNSYIEVSSSGILNVGDQIRRSTSTDEGILSFVQNSGTVNIGTVGGNIESTRGMFEILGTGSSFTQGDTDVLNIDLTNGSTTIPSLYFAPETVTYGSSSGIKFDGTSEAAGTFVLYAEEALNNVEVAGDDNDVVKLNTIPHTINGNLTIGANSILNANGLSLSLGGNLINNGTFTANNNVTNFIGDSDQTISGSALTTFANLVKHTGTGTLILGRAISVSDDLTLSSGVLNTATFELTVQGDLTNDVTTSSSGNGIVLSGPDVQQISGSGSYDVLTINNANGVVLPTQSGALNIEGSLRLQSGVFDIGRNLIVFDEDASIEEVAAFSSTNMIQTNLSFTDNGIEKYFPVISSGTTNFIYPIGSLGKYTPVEMNITANGTNTGSIRVKAADEPHVSVPEADQGEVLQYNWTLDADGISGFTADVLMSSYDDDAVGDTAAYYTARILLGSVNWNKYTTNEFMGYADATDISKFTFSNTNDAGIDGDYTAGGAIPDEVQAFISVGGGGPWTTTTTWATYDPDTETIGTPGDGVPAGTGPKGAIVYIDNGDEVTMPTNFMSAYRTYIRNTGTLSVGSSYGHRLGDVYGTGTLKLVSGDTPAGFFDDFFSSSGGTIEYAGTTTYGVLSELPTVNNVTFSGSGTRELPNIDVQLYGDLTINGPHVDNTHNTNLSLQGDVIFTSGTFDAGLEVLPKSPIITFNGSSLQTVSGATEFISADGGVLFNLEVDNSAGVDLASNVEVSNKLILTNGVIRTTTTEVLKLTNTSTSAITGGSSSSYVDGPIQKDVLNSSTFTFPVGYSTTYAPIDVSPDASSGGFWEVEYIGINPGSYVTRTMDPETTTSPVAYVSHTEFWRVKAPAVSDQAQLTLGWGAHSGVTPDADFKLVQWTSAAPSWEQVAIGAPTGDSNSGSVSTSGNISFNDDWAAEGNYITFGSISIPSGTWQGDVVGDETDWFNPNNWVGGTVPNAGSDVTIPSTANDPIIDNSALAQVNNLTIATGVTLTLSPGAQMTVNGDVVSADNDAIIIQNSVSAPSSFIYYGTITDGNPTYADRSLQVEWTYADNRYFYVGHSIDGVTYTEYDTPTSNPFNLYRYSGGWVQITGAGDLDGTENELEGYAVKFGEGGNVTITHNGLLNNGSYSYTLNGNNLLANPYQSYIDVESAGFVAPSEADKTVYTSTNATGSLVYASYNWETHVGVNDGTRYIAPGQGFWIVGTSATDFTMSTLARTHSFDTGNGILKSASVATDNILRMELVNGELSDEIAMVFRPDGSADLIDADSRKRMGSGTEVPNLFTLKGESKVVIGLYPESMNITSVPIGYNFAKVKKLTIKATNLADFAELNEVYLVDKVEGVTIDLRQTPEYTFISSGAEESDRFELRFESGVTTDIKDEQQTASSKNVLIYVTKQSATVRVSEELLRGTNKVIEVYDLMGQLVNQYNLNSTETKFNLPNANTMYIIKVSIDRSSYQEKVVCM